MSVVDETLGHDVVLELGAVAAQLNELVAVISGETITIPKKFVFDATRYVQDFRVKDAPNVFHAVKVDNPTDHPVYVGFGSGTGQPGQYDEIIPARTGRIITRGYQEVSIGFAPGDIAAGVTYAIPATFYSRPMPPVTYAFNPAGSGGGTLTPAPGSTAAAVTTVADATADQQLLAVNLARLGASIYNDSTATLYVKLGGVASATDYSVSLGDGDYYELPGGYMGAVHGIWSADTASGAARVTELS